MTFSILWELNIAYSLATLFYKVATFQSASTVQPDGYPGGSAG